MATDDLKVAVNATITLERPLLVKGEPGTGKTVLALEIAQSVGAPLKNEQDVHLFERLAFMTRRDGRQSGLCMARRERRA